MEKVEEFSKIYNSTYEVSIRVLLLLSKLNGNSSTLNNLMIFDYLSLNTYDIGGPASLHAPIPNRGTQLYSRKVIVERSLKYLISKQLIKVNPTDAGIEYLISEYGFKFLEYFESTYFNNLKNRIIWTIDQFGNLSNSEMKEFINNNMSKWGQEFMADNNTATKV